MPESNEVSFEVLTARTGRRTDGIVANFTAHVTTVKFIIKMRR